jgi:predicted CopG family antitoxin
LLLCLPPKTMCFAVVLMDCSFFFFGTLKCCVYICMYGVSLARQISVSNEVYELLLERKGKKSFSQVIKECIGPKKKVDILSLAGILKDDKENLEQLKKQIEAEREANYGRTFE